MTLKEAREFAKSMGWYLRKLRRPVRYRGRTIRYTLTDHLGELYCTSLQEVSERLREARKRGPHGHNKETLEWNGLHHLLQQENRR